MGNSSLADHNPTVIKTLHTNSERAAGGPDEAGATA
jgi:hypothetical protein